MKQQIEITADTRGAAQGFEEVKNKAASTGKDVKQLGEKVSKAGSAFSAIGSAAGQHLGHAGQVISALTSGPMALLSVAIGSILAAGINLWDRLTLSAEEYGKKIDGIASRMSAMYQKTTTRQTEDTGYLDRLKTLAGKDTLGAAGKSEAATLIEILTKRYGDLGIQVDAVTGKITGLDEAQKKMAQKQQQERSDAIGKKYASGMKSLENEFVQAEETGRGQLNFGGPKAIKALFQASGGNLDMLSAFAEKALANAKTADAIDAWNRVLEKVNAMKDVQIELRNVRSDGSGSEKERASRAAKTTNEEEAAAAKAKAAADADEKSRQAAEKQIENLEKELKYRQLILQGKEKEAAIEKALDQARASSNGKLTKEQENRIRLLAGAQFDLSKAGNAPAAKKFSGAGGNVEVFNSGLQSIGAKGGLIRASEDKSLQVALQNGATLKNIHQTLQEVQNTLKTSKGLKFI